MKIIDFLRRYIKNLLKLNNLKFKVDVLDKQHISLKSDIFLLQEENKSLKVEVESLKQEINTINDSINENIAKQIFYQSLSLQQRVDQFIFDANIEINRKIISQD